MNSEVKAKWLEALRSGEYEQGEGYLDVLEADGTRKFCCLGVLCDLAVKDGLEIEFTRTENGGTGFYGNAGERYSESAFLPKAVQDWAGVDSEGSIPGDGVDITNKSGDEVTENALIAVNDSGVPFTKIADLIEERF